MDHQTNHDQQQSAPTTQSTEFDTFDGMEYTPPNIQKIASGINGGDDLKPDEVLALQRTHGNHYVQRLVGKQDNGKVDNSSFLSSFKMMTPSESGDYEQVDPDTQTLDHDELPVLQRESMQSNDTLSSDDRVIPSLQTEKTEASSLQRTEAVASPQVTSVSSDNEKSKKIQRGPMLKAFAKGLADATILGGALSWVDFVQDMRKTTKTQGMTYEETILYGDGNAGVNWLILDKQADMIKAFTNTFTSLGVLSAFAALIPGAAPIFASLSAAFALLATTGHGIAMILKAIMAMRDTYRLNQIKKTYGKDSMEYAMVRSKRWADGASAAGSLLGLLSSGLLGVFGGGNFFAAYDPAATAATISELGSTGAAKGAGTVAASAGSAQAFGSTADTIGGFAEQRGKTIRSKNVPPEFADLADDTEDDSAEPSEDQQQVIQELAEEIQLVSAVREEDSSNLDNLTEKATELQANLPQVSAKMSELTDATDTAQSETESMDGDLDKLAETADASKANDSEVTAEQLEQADKEIAGVEEQMDLPVGTNMTLVVTDESGNESAPNTGDGTLPDSSESMPPPKLTVTDEHGNTGAPDMSGGGTIVEDETADPKAPEFVNRKEKVGSVQSQNGTLVIQRGIGAKIKKKFGSIKKWMSKKLLNFKGRLVKLVAKIKAKVTSAVAKVLGVDKDIAQIQPTVEKNTADAPQVIEAGSTAKQSTEGAQEAVDKLKSGLG